MHSVESLPRYYFEDFVTGMTVELDGPTLSEEEIIHFATRYDPQSFHVDPVRARQSIYGGLIASGWHTVSVCMRLICDAYLLRSASLGSPGVKDVRWLKPVRPGDQLKMRMTVEGSKPSRSKPDRGTVEHRWQVFNHAGELVLEMIGYGMFLKRPRAKSD
jgi:acyl dehydratase